MVLQLAPDDDDAERHIRDALDRRSTREIAAAFREWQGSLFDESMTVSEVQESVANLQAPRKVKDVLQRALVDASDLGVSVAIDQLGSIGFDYTLVFTEARDAATRYSYELVQGIEDSTRRMLRESVGRWIENGEPLPKLIDDIAPAFGKQRAKLIAQTESTRAFAIGNQRSMEASGVVDEMEWLTAEDERVCKQCGGLNGKRRPLHGTYASGEGAPPAHPGCRCDERGVVKEIA